jgi:acyl-[acyl-carrier-protein]-phospholipid O-acyltransferase/long-chain-fatty-acid--[acyl-carrier-protein] ligase
VLHWICWLAAKLVYRIRVHGAHHIPAGGPALVVCNHVSYVDGILLLAASRRHVRFVIDAEFVNRGVVGWFLRRIGAVAMPRGGPKATRAALTAIGDALKGGALVGVFPEAYPTRCGTMLPFKRGFELIARHAGVPVVPACIDRMWGSVWSYFGGRLFWKLPHRGKGPVRVAFGPPLPAEATTFQARCAVQRLLAECAQARARTILPVHRQFIRRASAQPFRPCLIDTGGQARVLNYLKTAVGAVCLAKCLRRRLGKTPMVGIWLPSSTGGVFANLALCLLGKTAVNLNYTAGPDLVRSAVRQCGIRHVLTSKRFLAKLACDPGEGVELIALEEILPQVGRGMKLAALLQVLLLPRCLVDRALGLGRHRADDLATVVFSSGSTGEPKGVMLTHANIAANVDAFLEHADFTREDRVLGILPFFHSFGYTVTMWGPLLVGGSATYLPDPRAAKEVGDAAREQRCTVMASTATFLRFYLRRCGADDFQTMRLVVCGAEKLPVSLADDFAEKFSVRPLEGYGCTELAPVVSVNMPDAEVAGLRQVRSRAGTIGHPLPGVACRVAHPDTGEPLAEGEEGLLWVTGPNVMRGYLHRDEETQKKVRDGWYDTGDIGKLDGDGFITLTGRLSRFAKIGGEMVPLERLEEEFHAVLSTTDRVIAVAAVPDDKRGERIVVLHLALPDGRDARSLCGALSDRGLPNLWVPDARDFFAVDEMPILGSGKLDLQRLKQLALAAACPSDAGGGRSAV